MSAGQDFVVARRIVLTVLSLIFGIPVALIAWLFLLEWTITYWPWSTLIPLAFVAFVAAVIRACVVAKNTARSRPAPTTSTMR